MGVSLPYQLADGTKAYANKVMANFNTLLQYLNSVDIPGVDKGDMIAVLTYLADSLENKVAAGEKDNAAEIIFADGESLKKKYRSGELHLGLLQTQSGFYFYVDENGHLMLVTNREADADNFSIDENGHLLYTVPDPETDDVDDTQIFDLGRVRGEEGEPGKNADGDMASAVYDPKGRKKDLNTYEYDAYLYAAEWDSNKKIVVQFEASTPTNHLEIAPALSANADQRKAWRAAQLYADSDAQTVAGQFVLGCDGDVPQVDIPITVRVTA